MDKFKGITTLFLFWFIIISHGITSTVADAAAQNKDEKPPSASEMIREMYSLITKSSITYWDRLKSLINQAQTQLFPPNLDFRGRDGTGGRVKDAAEKSLKTSKVTVEESANSAGKAVGEAVHKTAEKVKESMADTDGSHAEL
ncbi:uncharacterized protein LOC132267303 [Cornus florida]|uniref:uncharacterized protein LOC132267303 n=1 Tax=Cornus florida TaxID=4283 RepID=UPI002899580C|nr:uncharacterized protein LOC132267303 [Cornus florida]